MDADDEDYDADADPEHGHGHGIQVPTDTVGISTEAVETLVKQYCREAGVRSLQVRAPRERERERKRESLDLGARDVM